MQRLENPIPLWIDTRGALIDAGYIYVGIADGDPETSPINLFLDQALTQPIAQPLRTLGGQIVSGANAVNVYYAEAAASIRVRDVNGVIVSYVADNSVSAVAYQPEDSDLTAIAALATTPYGRNFLTLANQAALVAALGLPAALPQIGGTVTGNIMRGGAGVHVYHADPAMTGGRVYVTASGAADPTSQAGDIWLEAQ